MTMKNDQLSQLISEAIEDAGIFFQARPANEYIENFDQDKYKEICKNINELLLPDDEILLSNVDYILSVFKYPRITVEDAGHEHLQIRTKGQNFIDKIREIKDLLTESNRLRSSSSSKDVLISFSTAVAGDMQHDLKNLTNSVEKLSVALAKKETSGIAFTFGPVSIDAAVLSQLVDNVRTKAREAFDYVGIDGTLNAGSLKQQLEEINEKSSSIFESIKSNSKIFGKKIVAQSQIVREIASNTYIKGLLYIKNAVDRRIQLASNNSGSAGDEFLEAIDATFWTDKYIEDLALPPIKKRLFAAINDTSKHNEINRQYPAAGRVTYCMAREDNGRGYVVFYIKEAKITIGDYIEARAIPFAFEINKADYDLISNCPQDKLTASAIQAFEIKPRGQSEL